MVEKYPLTFASDDIKMSEKLRQRLAMAWDTARKAADLLGKNYGATRVVVFGSLAHKLWFTERSDIDLASWGVPYDRFYRAVAAVNDLSPEFKIDLVDAEDCSDSLKKAIREEGSEL